MLFLYSLCLYLLTPFLLLRLWWKGRRTPAYRQRINERFAWAKPLEKPVDVWLHAVSLGELITAIPLIEALLAKKQHLLITTTTVTGSQRVQAHFGNKLSHQYLPYDLPLVLNHFFKKIKPKLGIIIETELWPNLISQATKANIPLVLANARLSENSFKSYQKFKFIFKPLLNQFHSIMAQSEDDGKRFKALGVKDEKIALLGNMKFDLQSLHIDSSEFLTLKARWGNERTVVIAASTHGDEEKQVLSRLRHLQASIPNVLLIIAPRHPERFQEVYQLSKQFSFNTGLRSQAQELNSQNEVVIADSLGELLGFYQISDYAFVGGSLVPIGGHNILEPIAMKAPVLVGPYMNNFKTICHDLKTAEAIEIVAQADELITRIIELEEDRQRKSKQVKNATQVLEANKGTVARYLQRIEPILLSKS